MYLINCVQNIDDIGNSVAKCSCQKTTTGLKWQIFLGMISLWLILAVKSVRVSLHVSCSLCSSVWK